MVSYRVVPCRTLSYCVVPCRTVSYRVVPCRTVSYRAVPCRTVSYRVVLCRTVSLPYDTLYDTVRRVVHPRRVGPTRRAPTPCTTLYDASYAPDVSGPDALYDAPTRRTVHFRQHSAHGAGGDGTGPSAGGRAQGLSQTALARCGTAAHTRQIPKRHAADGPAQCTTTADQHLHTIPGTLRNARIPPAVGGVAATPAADRPRCVGGLHCSTGTDARHCPPRCAALLLRLLLACTRKRRVGQHEAEAALQRAHEAAQDAGFQSAEEAEAYYRQRHLEAYRTLHLARAQLEECRELHARAAYHRAHGMLDTEATYYGAHGMLDPEGIVSVGAPYEGPRCCPWPRVGDDVCRVVSFDVVEQLTTGEGTPSSPWTPFGRHLLF